MRSTSVLTILRQAITGLLLLLVLLLVPTHDAPAEAGDSADADSSSTTTTTEPTPTTEPAPSPDPSEPQAPEEKEEVRVPSRVRAGIDVMTIQGQDSESAGDFKTGDSVAAFDASDLEALGAQSVADLAAFTPNLEIVTTGATTPTFFIRGVGLNDFNANSTSAVAIYQDDVQLNSPALQLSSIFDVGNINILRGPQGTGQARSASAGAIKIYANKPSGEYGGTLRQDYGNYNYRDYEGMIEAPIFRDIIAGRLAFRFSEREGYARNGCGNAPPITNPDGTPGRATSVIDPSQPSTTTTRFVNQLVNGEVVRLPLSICGENVPRVGNTNPDGISDIAEGLPIKMNDLGNWAIRGSMIFRPTLDQEWLLTGRYANRDQLAGVGQSIGTGIGLADIENPGTLVQVGLLGARDGNEYIAAEVEKRLFELNPCKNDDDGSPNGLCPPGINPGEDGFEVVKARLALAEELAHLDSKPHTGDFNLAGPTKNEVWGISLKGDIALGRSLSLTTVTSYDTYDRINFGDIDATPNVIAEAETDDTGWQFYQGLDLSGDLFEKSPLHWNVGLFYLMEELDVVINSVAAAGAENFVIARRDYIQSLWSAAGYVSFDWDLSSVFTLDAGMRYNWEQKEMDYLLTTGGPGGFTTPALESLIWKAPTGTVRLTYKFRENTHAFFKFTRGWKGGHFNATATQRGVFAADPEEIDSFEIGMRGAWLDGRLGLSFSLFHYSYRNYQIFTTDQQQGGPIEFVVINANDAEVFGAELELMARTDSGLFLSANFGWLESEFLDFVQRKTITRSTGGLGTVPVDTEIQNSGNRLLNSPQWKVSLTAEQTVKLGRYGQLVARWDGAWTADTFYDASGGRGTPDFDGEQFYPENAIGQQAYWLHNLRLAYTTPSGRIEVALWMRNVTDEVYKAFAFDGSTISKISIYFVGQPRTQGLTISTRF